MAKLKKGAGVGIGLVLAVTLILGAVGLTALVNSATADVADAPVIVTPTAAQVAECDYSNWLGKKAEEAEANVKATGRPYRMIHTGDPVTMDFNAERINVELDANDVVVKVTCG